MRARRCSRASASTKRSMPASRALLGEQFGGGFGIGRGVARLLDDEFVVEQGADGLDALGGAVPGEVVCSRMRSGKRSMSHSGSMRAVRRTSGRGLSLRSSASRASRNS